jgi:hypothetical protein
MPTSRPISEPYPLTKRSGSPGPDQGLGECPLWSQLSALEITPPDQPLTFETRLARENGWGRDRAWAVVQEYKRFLYLMLTAGHPVTPSEDIDIAWHLHLLYTRSYWDDLCGRIAQRPLHHLPSNGRPTDGQKFWAQYEQTLDSYRCVFQTEPPADIWPTAGERFRMAGQSRWVDPADYYLIPKPLKHWRRRWFRFFLGAKQ